MKKFLPYIFLFSFIGCTPSSIKINVKGNPSADQYGFNSLNNFYQNVTIQNELKKVWEVQTNGTFENSMPAALGEYLFINDLSGRVSCINTNTKKIIGELKYDDGAIFSTPVLNGKTIIYAAALEEENTSILIYYDISSGKELNQKEIKGRIQTHLLKNDNGVFFVCENGSAYHYDFKGNEKWKTETKKRTHSAPAMNDSNLFFGNDEGEITAISLADGKINYQKAISESVLGNVSINDQKIFLGSENGILYSLNIENGSTAWKYDSGDRITASPSYDENGIYFGTLGGNLFALSHNGSLKWKTYLDGVLNSSILVTASYLFAGNLENKFDIVNKVTGEIYRTYLVEGRVRNTPIFFNQYLIIGSDDGLLSAYESID